MSNKIGTKQASLTRDDEIDLAALIHELVANKWLIIIITAITLSLGGMYAYHLPPIYQSDVLLQVENGRSPMGGLEQLAFGGSGGANASATQMSLIKSRYVLEPVVKELNLDILVEKKTTILERLFKSNVVQAKGIRVQTFDVSHSKLNKYYTVVIDKPGFFRLFDSNKNLILHGPKGKLLANQDNTVRIHVESINAPMGTQFTLLKRSEAKAQSELAAQLKVEESGNVKSFQGGTGILNVSLKGYEPHQLIKTLNAIAITAKDLDAKKKSQEASQTLAFLYQQLPITKKELETAEYDLNRYRAKSGKIDIKLQSQALINQFSELAKDLNKLHVEKINMQQRYTALHPMLIAVNTQIQSLENQRHKLDHSLKKLPASDQLAVNLFREVKVKKTLYVILLNKIQELEVIKAGTISAIHVLAKAKLPDMALPNHRGMIYLGSTLLGLLLSAMIIMGRNVLFSRITDPYWAEKEFNLPNLAVIPYSKGQAILSGSHEFPKKRAMLAHEQPRDLAIESLRSLRTSLQVSLAGASNNIICILGASPGIGKSFVSANLAYLLASAGKKVLLIDADLRRGTLHQYMNIPSSPGLAEVLSNELPIQEALVKTLNDNLTVLPRGTYPIDPSELLMSSALSGLMQEMSAQYDLILIDTAPVLLVTDGVIVGGLAGTNYIVLGAGVHQPMEIEMALKRIVSAGVQLHGSIFNFHKQQAKKESAGKSYQYYSYSNYYDDESTKVKS